MAKYIQVGVTALRDPVTGDFLPAVPLYIREDDAEKVPKAPDRDMRAALVEKMRTYRAGLMREGLVP